VVLLRPVVFIPSESFLVNSFRSAVQLFRLLFELYREKLELIRYILILGYDPEMNWANSSDPPNQN